VSNDEPVPVAVRAAEATAPTESDSLSGTYRPCESWGMGAPFEGNQARPP
jgi:hypothetical protein